MKKIVTGNRPIFLMVSVLLLIIVSQSQHLNAQITRYYERNLMIRFCQHVGLDGTVVGPVY